MKILEPLPHWNNFTVPELKEILEHCVALERLGIRQDDEMLLSIERDIVLREKKISGHYMQNKPDPTKMKLPMLQNRIKTNSSKRSSQNRKQQPEEYLLEQKV